MSMKSPKVIVAQLGFTSVLAFPSIACLFFHQLYKISHYAAFLHASYFDNLQYYSSLLCFAYVIRRKKRTRITGAELYQAQV